VSTSPFLALHFSQNLLPTPRKGKGSISDDDDDGMDEGDDEEEEEDEEEETENANDPSHKRRRASKTMQSPSNVEQRDFDFSQPNYPKPGTAESCSFLVPLLAALCRL
jgi:hypothetical protein